MNNLKSKIVTLKYFKIIFYSIFVSGSIGFLISTASIDENIVRNGSISIVLMIFGLVAVEVCNRLIKLYINEFKMLRSKKNKVKIIDFEKIA